MADSTNADVSETPAPPATETKKPVRMRFKQVLREEPFDMEDKDGEVREYTLRECPNVHIARWMSQNAGRQKLDKGGQPTGVMDKHEGYMTSLLCKMVFDDKGQPVEQAKLDVWPNHIILQLFERAMLLNAQTEEGVQEAKNG